MTAAAAPSTFNPDVSMGSFLMFCNLLIVAVICELVVDERCELLLSRLEFIVESIRCCCNWCCWLLFVVLRWLLLLLLLFWVPFRKEAAAESCLIWCLALTCCW